ncbi:hypothetical protein NECAME_15301, partial [Necator americanus]
SQSSNSEPGYLPDYQGDRYTNPARITETQALNKPFFDQLGYVPPAPPQTPAQLGGQGQPTGSGYAPPQTSAQQLGGQMQPTGSGYAPPQTSAQQRGGQMQPTSSGYAPPNPSSSSSGGGNPYVSQGSSMYGSSVGGGTMPYVGSSAGGDAQYDYLQNYVEPMQYGRQQYTTSMRSGPVQSYRRYTSSYGYANQQYNPSSTYYSTPSSSQQYYNPSLNSNSPTRNYNAVLNTNLGYAGQVQREQTQQYGYGNMQQQQYANPNDPLNRVPVSYGYYGSNQLYNDQQYGNQQQQQQQYYGNRQYDSSNYQSWCCGPTSTSCCYQTSNSNSMQYYDPSISSNQKYTTTYGNQQQYGTTSTISPYLSLTTTRSYGKKK